MIRAEVPRAAAELARSMRLERRRTPSGRRRPRPWREIRDELERRGFGRWAVAELEQAIAVLPLASHPLAPPSDAERERIDEGWRRGWMEDHPGQAWPGLEEAQRRARAEATGYPRGSRAGGR